MKSNEMMRCPKCEKAIEQTAKIKDDYQEYQVMMHCEDSGGCEVDYIKIVLRG